MGWSDWFKDSSGGEVSEKVTKDSSGGTKTDYLRTEDNAKSGSHKDHSHVVVREKSDGTKTASSHGIRGGRQK
ncbi:hypothetical protein HZA26_00870 [Candidatus Nomurabacteria bacterium]|nr:hypothetical protein [Candidatus Nomurabacteria bacterium]